MGFSSKFKRVTIAVFAVMISFLMSACSMFTPEEKKLEAPKDSMTVSFVDVGQGDCIFVALPNGENMLVDCGEYSERDTVEGFLLDNGVSRIDYLVATHPHADHMGGMAHIIKNFDIGEFFMPDKEADSKAFITMLEALDEKKVKSTLVRDGDIIFEDDSFRCDVLSPVLDEYDETNDVSVILKLSCGEKSFLLTGDAEEYAIRQMDADLNADVLKVGHHGSVTSTTEEFLDDVSPSYAVICCGKDNSYGHPHKEVLELLKEKNIKVYRTDTDGTVAFICDGNNIEIK